MFLEDYATAPFWYHTRSSHLRWVSLEAQQEGRENVVHS